MYTPATHIEIISPTELKNNDIELIIIMAGSYCDEIKRKIKEEHNKIDILLYKENKIYEEKISK